MSSGIMYVIIGPTSAESCLFGSQPVSMNRAVINPQARIAPMLGRTIAARYPPYRWIRSCTLCPPLHTTLGRDQRSARATQQAPKRRRAGCDNPDAGARRLPLAARRRDLGGQAAEHSPEPADVGLAQQR